MMDWTDRHCRYFHRLLAPGVRLYTEMITARAILAGDRDYLLGFDPSEHPVAVQLGGSDPAQLAEAARIAEGYGYDEVNLNVGCPSPRVSAAEFGACLMKDPALVASCLAAMRAAVGIPVTVKHRIGVDELDSEDFLFHFVGQVAAAGIDTFIVHARKALLQGLSPKENRSIPPLVYERAWRLKRQFPALTVVVNGGIGSVVEVQEQLRHVDGVMIGRRAYDDPWLLTDLQREVLAPDSGHDWPPPAREQVAMAMADYLASQPGLRSRHVTRHMLGLYHGQPGARAWRRWLSDPARDGEKPHAVIHGALAAMNA
jgi:tRNA-dihydrouridine synthase A